MEPSTQNSPFIKQLASSDRQTRDKALESLRLFLRGRAQVEEIELLKLWKGLFYCMWMSDKPRAQQQLAVDYAALVDSLHENATLPFIDAFWKTMAREWNGIDVLRMNKFLFLIRQYLAVSFKYLSRQGWSNTKAIDKYMEILSATPLHPSDNKIPDGMRYHVLDIYVDELDKIDSKREGKLPLKKLLGPIETMKTEGKTKTIRKRADETLEDERLKDWNNTGTTEASGSSNEQEGAEDDNEEWGGLDD